MNVNGFVAFAGGVLSFFAPCVLPLVPSFLIYISGCSISTYSELSDRKICNTVRLHAIAFIVGFSFVFISLGFSSSFLGNVFSEYETWIMRVGGLMLVVMGVNTLGLLNIPFLNQEKMVHLHAKPVGLVGSFVVGITFSLGWTPCIGPVLASILLIASAGGSPFAGVRLLGLYSLGRAIPFFIAAMLVTRLMGFMRRYGHIVKHTSMVLGRASHRPRHPPPQRILEGDQQSAGVGPDPGVHSSAGRSHGKNGPLRRPVPHVPSGVRQVRRRPTLLAGHPQMTHFPHAAGYSRPNCPHRPFTAPCFTHFAIPVAFSCPPSDNSGI